MKQAFLKYLKRFSYPQKVFAKSIKRYLDTSENSTLIDAPCGEGITSWHLAQLNNLTVYGYDLSPNSIKTAQETFHRSNLHYRAANVHDIIFKHTGAKYFCIINSLFLLPDTDELLQAIRNSIATDGTLFIAIPNIAAHNFIWFEKNNAGINKFTIAENEIEHYFSKRGWALKNKDSICYATSMGRHDVAMFSIFGSIYLGFLNYFQTILKAGKPNYFLLVLQKDGN